MASHRAPFNWADPLLLDAQLSDTERMVQDSARAYCQDKLLPRVQEAFRHEKTDVGIFREMVSGACWVPPSPRNTVAPGSTMSVTG